MIAPALLPDPARITKLDRSQGELQMFLLFAVLVAGHDAYVTLASLKAFFEDCRPYETPFEYIGRLDAGEPLDLYNRVVAARFGNFTKNETALRALARCPFDLRTVTIEELETIHGIGPKTSRFFVQHSRGEAVAALDTHLLKWLRERGYDAPKSTPTSKKLYRELEAAYLIEAGKLYADPALLDLRIWRYYRGLDKTCPGLPS